MDPSLLVFGLAPVLVVLIIDAAIVASAWRSPKSTTAKIAWTIVIFTTHVVGWVLYFLFGYPHFATRDAETSR